MCYIQNTLIAVCVQIKKHVTAEKQIAHICTVEKIYHYFRVIYVTSAESKDFHL